MVEERQAGLREMIKPAGEYRGVICMDDEKEYVRVGS